MDESRDRKRCVLVTGGLGYIGSHTSVALLGAGYDIVILDNLSNSHRGVLNHIEHLSDRKPIFIQGDIRDRIVLDRIFAQHSVAAVVHFAGVKAVGESCQQPLAYYDVNVAGSFQLLSAMIQGGVRRCVFSSSATVYGEPDHVPVSEKHRLGPLNPYGRTKRIIEEALGDLCVADRAWSAIALRYFNPAGAHPSGLIGDDPASYPNNLFPFIGQVLDGRREVLEVFGSDYPTDDGSAVRDYIHVMDLADAHVKAVAKSEQAEGFHAINIGSGQGHSVLEVITTYERASGQVIPKRIVGRRPGDAACCFADAKLAAQWLHFSPQRNLWDMCRDAWCFSQRNLKSGRAPSPTNNRVSADSTGSRAA